MPEVEEVRPRRCPRCERGSRPLGAPLVVVGHGTRERQVRGPRAPGAAPELRVVTARRYRCRGCGAVIVVVPRGVVARRHFGAGAIGLALLRYGAGVVVIAIRAELGGLGETASWPALTRWVAAVRRGEMFAKVRSSPEAFTPRQVAQRAAMTLCACAPPSSESMSPEAGVYAGATLAA